MEYPQGISSMEDILVLAIDMCSSSKLIDDLSVDQNLNKFSELIQELYEWLQIRSRVCNYEIYQFTGDGWILFFHNPKIDGEALMNFLVEISRAHNKFRKKLIDIHLHALPESTGLTFGLDMGSLQKFILGGETRYVGHALNVACKLQDSVKQKGPESSLDYRGLISNSVYKNLLKNPEVLSKYTFFSRIRSLRNIDTKFKCKKINLSLFI